MFKMKFLQEFILGFSRVERIGFSFLSLLLILAIGFRIFLAFQIKERPRSAEDQRLADIYQKWKMQNMEREESSFLSKKKNSELFFFDPNTLDSAGFIQLGMPPKAIRGLLNWRQKGKRFRKAEDLAPLYNLPPELYEQLKPFIRIESVSEIDFRKKDDHFSIPKNIELNAADSALLDRAIAGIGPALAHRIIERREALGGFLRFEQLMEIYRFPDSVFMKMKERFSLDPGKVQKIDLNNSDEETMSRHPYIGPKTARNILLYRQGIGHYSDLQQLREVPLMSEEIYRKIAPYFIIK